MLGTVYVVIYFNIHVPLSQANEILVKSIDEINWTMLTGQTLIYVSASINIWYMCLYDLQESTFRGSPYTVLFDNHIEIMVRRQATGLLTGSLKLGTKML